MIEVNPVELWTVFVLTCAVILAFVYIVENLGRDENKY